MQESGHACRVGCGLMLLVSVTEGDGTTELALQVPWSRSESVPFEVHIGHICHDCHTVWLAAQGKMEQVGTLTTDASTQQVVPSHEYGKEKGKASEKI